MVHNTYSLENIFLQSIYLYLSLVILYRDLGHISAPNLIQHTTTMCWKLDMYLQYNEQHEYNRHLHCTEQACSLSLSFSNLSLEFENIMCSIKIWNTVKLKLDITDSQHMLLFPYHLR